MPKLKLSKCFTTLLMLTFLIMPLSHVFAGSLDFDPETCTTKTFTAGAVTVTALACEGIVYVSNPVAGLEDYQSMNFYVPEGVAEDDTTTTIFFPNKVGGYNPALPWVPGPKTIRGEPVVPETPNTALVALSKGYIVASAGARGKTQDYGRAPAGIVDLKAAVRYLRYNDDAMPGDAEKIISNGTSAGGAMSALLGATGNNRDYEPYLEEIGAADARDDVFAASCYCPITNLDNSDMAYEWLFNGEHVWHWFLGPTDLTDEQIILSDLLKAMFPAYLNRLGLRAYAPGNAKGCGPQSACGQIKKGPLLTLDEYGEGNFNDYAKSFVIASAQEALDSGEDFSGPEFDWMTIEDGKITDIDLAGYAAYVTRMKPVPAFDSVDLSGGGTWENILFGTENIGSQHFTRFSLERDINGDEFMADAQIIKMMSPMDYIGTGGSTITKNWRIRHGAADRDTSIAIPIILTTKLWNAGYKVDFALPWGQGHGGDYDLDELFAWMEDVSDSSYRNCHRHRHRHHCGCDDDDDCDDDSDSDSDGNIDCDCDGDKDPVEGFVHRFYRQCLDRDPDRNGLNEWVRALKAKNKTGAHVARGFIFSNEFIEKKKSNEDYLEILYKAFFDRAPDKAGRLAWLKALGEGRSRGQILDGFLFSDEFKNLCNAYGIKGN